MVTRGPPGSRPARLCAMSGVGEVSSEAFRPDCDIEGRPGEQVAGARVGVRAHEHDDRQRLPFGDLESACF